MERLESRCKDCLYLVQIKDEGDGRIAQCAIQGNVNPMQFSLAVLDAERHPQGICEDGLMSDIDTCHAYQSKNVDVIDVLTHQRREELDLIRKAQWILQLHNTE